MSTIISLSCVNCATPLKIPKNSKKVQCPSCLTECIVDGFSKNAEIIAKDNINSGIPLSATPDILHNKLAQILLDSQDIPIDVFEKIVVVRANQHYIPAYMFHCNGTSSFTYEAGVSRTETIVENLKNVEKTYIEWHPGSSSAAVSQTVIASGNRDFDFVINKLYVNLNSNKLVDIEDITISDNVDVHNYNIPEFSAFSENVVPVIDNMLNNKANESVSKLNVRNLTMGGSNIQKDVIRVILGLYNIVYTYKDKEFSIWFSGDGVYMYYDNIPTDHERIRKRDELTKTTKQKKPGIHIFYTLGIIFCSLFFFFILPLIGTVIFSVLLYRKNKDYKLFIKNAKLELDNFNELLTTSKNNFTKRQKRLHGIYENEK